jgi:hypothetical protein
VCKLHRQKGAVASPVGIRTASHRPVALALNQLVISTVSYPIRSVSFGYVFEAPSAAAPTTAGLATLRSKPAGKVAPGN